MRLYDEDRSLEVKEFIKEIVEVCKKHNLSISHEDCHGGFEIENYDEYNIKWFSAASDLTK